MVTPSSRSSGLLSSLQLSLPFLASPRTPSNPTQGEIEKCCWGRRDGTGTGSLSPALASCCCRERRDQEGADLQGNPAGVRTLMKLLPPGFRYHVSGEVLLWCWYSGITSVCHVFLLWGADCLVSPREKHCFVLAGGVSASQGDWSCPSLFVPLCCDFVTRVQKHRSFWSENGFAAFCPFNRSCTFFFANRWQGCAYGY